MTHLLVGERPDLGVERDLLGPTGCHVLLQLVAGRLERRPLDRLHIVDRIDLAALQGGHASGGICHELPVDLIDVRRPGVQCIGRGRCVVLVAHQDDVLPPVPLLHDEGAGADRGRAVLILGAGLQSLLRLDAEVPLRQVHGEVRIRLREVDLEGRAVDGLRRLVVPAQPDRCRAVAARDPVAEVVGDRRSIHWAAVGECHALLEREGPRQAVGGRLPRLGQPGHDLVMSVERGQVVEYLVREVRLLDPPAEHARRFLLVGVDDGAPLDLLTGGRRGARRARGEEQSAGEDDR